MPVLDQDFLLVINDSRRAGLYTGPLDAPVRVSGPVFFRGDGELVGVRLARDLGGGRLVSVSATGRTIRGFLGRADQAPTSGNHTIRITKTSSAADEDIVIAWNATESAVQTLVSAALTAVSGPAFTVEQEGVDFILTASTSGASGIEFESVANELAPASRVVVAMIQTSAEGPETWRITASQRGFAYFSPATPYTTLATTVTATHVQAGGVGVQAVQRLVLDPAPDGGSLLWQHDTLTGSRSFDATAESIASAIGDTFTVTTPSSGVYEFVGVEDGAQTLVSVNTENATAPNGVYGALNLDRASGIAALAATTAASISAILEFEVQDGADAARTAYQGDATIKRDALRSASGVFEDYPGSGPTFNERLTDVEEVIPTLVDNTTFTTSIDALNASVGSLSANYIFARDEKATGTPGGSASATTTHIRTLNALIESQPGGVSLASNRLTLPAGSYRVRASVPAYNCLAHRALIYDYTNSLVLLLGSTAYAYQTQTNSVISGQFAVFSPIEIEVRHYTGSAAATNGLGVDVNDGQTEVYTTLELWKE